MHMLKPGTDGRRVVDARMARLPPDQQALAARMVAFMARSDERYFREAEHLNGGRSPGHSPAERPGPERLELETDDTVYDVQVVRGEVVEKLGRMLAEGKKTQPGRREGVLVWGRFYSIDIHPKTPLVGMLHATLVLQFYADGTGFAGGWLGVMNGTRVDEDMQVLTSLVDSHFAEHGRDPAVYRKLMVKGTDDTVARFRRRPDPSGVSFYGPPLFPGDVARSYALVEGLFARFTDAYLGLVARHATGGYGPEDLARQEEMRKRWLVDQFLSDPFSSRLVPFEVWSLANAPPMIRF
jgi:hypothetical protein